MMIIIIKVMWESPCHSGSSITPSAPFRPRTSKTISQRITALYKPLPKFYVGIVFQEVAKESFYIGGQPTDNFVRVWVDHIARSFKDDADLKARWLNAVNQALAPFIADRGRDWEIHFDETPFDIWTIQGLRPPLPNSEAEKRWIAENRPTPY